MRTLSHWIGRLAYLVVCFCAGILADGLVLLFLRGVSQASGGAVGPYPFPYSLLLGGGIGILTALGFECGQAVRRHLGSKNGLQLLILLILFGAAILYVSLGVWTGLNGDSLSAPTTLISILVASVPLLLGMLSSLSGRPGTFTFSFGALIGPIAGVIFGLAAGITYVAAHQQSICVSHCLIIGGPAFAIYLITVQAVVSGLGVGFVAVCAQIAGLPFVLSRRPTPHETEQNVPPRSGLVDEPG